MQGWVPAGDNLMMDATENGIDVTAMFGHLTEDQRRQLAELDAAYIELLSRDVADNADVEGLAEAVVAFYDALLGVDGGRENQS